MYAMQYEIGLPADYDMAIIRRRVEERGHLLDDLPGLGLKAYLVREAGVNASPISEYAPFYVWTDAAAMARFLWGGGGFAGIVGSFGRPPVRHWTGAAFWPGEAVESDPVEATRRTELLDAHTDPADAVAAMVDYARKLACEPAAHSVAAAVDPTRWEVVVLALWTSGGAPAADGDSYRVLHLSRPCLPALSGSSRPDERLGDDDPVAVERSGRRSVKHEAEVERVAHAPAERLVVRAGEEPVPRQPARWGHGLDGRGGFPQRVDMDAESVDQRA